MLLNLEADVAGFDCIEGQILKIQKLSGSWTKKTWQTDLVLKFPNFKMFCRHSVPLLFLPFGRIPTVGRNVLVTYIMTY